MRIDTTRFGSLEVEDSGIIHVKGGILGFSGYQKYVLLDLDSSGPFKWLQCLEDPDLAFVVMDPRLVEPEYRVPLEADEAEALGIGETAECMVCAIVTIGASLSDVTVNLLGPILMNTRNNLARQLVLADSRYTVRHRILG